MVKTNLTLKSLMDNVNQSRRKVRFEDSKKQHKENEYEHKDIDNKYFSLLKDFTILTGTVFASSIALSVGKPTNNYFKFGELFLFISVVIGIFILWNQLKNAEWSYFFKVKGQLEGDIIVNKDIMENFEKKAVEDLIKNYNNLLNRKLWINYIFKFIKVDYLPSLFFINLLIGIFLILISIF